MHISMPRMIISCPECKAQYKLGSLIKNAILVCHRCGTEFNPNKEDTDVTVQTTKQTASLFDQPQHQLNQTEAQHTDKPSGMDKTPNIDTQQHHNTDTLDNLDEVQDIPTPLDESMLLPKRSSVRLWPWMVLVLMLVAGFGVWKNQAQWLNHPWVRSAMLQIDLPIKPRANDWRIIQENIQQQWIERQDKSRVLLINGYIQNRLFAAQISPDFLVSFADIPESGVISTRIMPLTEPPSLPQIKHAPYMLPPKDTVPIAANAKRAFTLVIEDVPEGTRHVALSIATPKQ